MSIPAPLGLAVLLLAARPALTQEVRAVVAMEHPERQFLAVQLELDGFDGAVDLVLPVWTPGSYKVRDYSQFVEGFQVVDSRAGRAVPFTKVAKNRWRLERAGHVTVTYRYFAAEKSVRHCYLDASHAFLMPGSMVPYVDGFLDHPYEIRLRLPEGWYADTALEEVDPGRFRARDYDELVDSPIQAGRHARHDFEVDGTVFRMTLTGDSNMDAAAMVKDMERVVRQAGEMFGGFPFERYLFLVRFGGGGGLEHRDSTALLTGGYGFDSKSGWQRFLGLVAHEFFHAWNVKRIRDQALGPFDYTKEVYTRLLWMHEGWTTYYGPVLQRRAGITEEFELLRSYERVLNGYKRRPGRLVQSLAESSFDSWIKYYQTTATSHNSTVDYYGHGRVAALCLDLILRHHSENRQGLDDVMRRLWDEFGRQDRGFTEEDLHRILVELGGPEAEEFWDRFVVAPGDIDLGRYLAYAGLEWKDRRKRGGEPPEEKTEAAPARQENGERDAEKPAADDRWEPWKQADLPHLGLTTTVSGPSMVVRTVERDGAAWQAGLAAGDELIAVGDQRVHEAGWETLLRTALDEGTLALTIARSGRLQTVTLRLDGRRPDYKLAKAKQADELAQAIYASLFSAPFQKAAVTPEDQTPRR